jgi:tetratricopeptide (TPR) repeat protein
MGEFNVSLTKLNEIQNHDDYQVIWFGSNINIPNEENIVDYLRKFDCFDACDNYIRGLKTERKILLVLTDSFEHLIDFNNLHQIQSIYILERINSQNINDEQKNYSKVIDIFPDEHKLIERLRQDILLTSRNDFSLSISSLNEISIQQSLTSLDGKSLMFIWNQLFLYFLVESSQIDMNKLKQDMIEQCQLEYENDQTELTKIKEFADDCTYDNVLHWYTRDSFVFRLVNKSFRTRDINLICKFRYFIILLYKKLKELSTEQQGTNYGTVYRGQTMKIDHLQNLISNVGNLISMNTIMSTTRNRNVAGIFLSNDEVKVLFEIDMTNDNSNNVHAFADIHQWSVFQEEEEVLFFAGAVFCVESIEPDDDSTWIIKLTLKNETAEKLEKLMEQFEYQLIQTLPWEAFSTKAYDFRLIGKYHGLLTDKSVTFKGALTNMKGVDIYYVINNFLNHKKMIEYYEKLLFDQNFIDHPKFIILHIFIGYNYFQLSECDNALNYYETALQLLDDDNHRLTGFLYDHIGDAWKMKKNFERALLYYKEALQILHRHYSNMRRFPIIYRKIADIHRIQNNYEDARISEEQANQWDENFIHTSELDHEKALKNYQNRLNTQSDLSSFERAEILHSMGLCLMNKGDYVQALEILLQAKQLFRDHFPPHGRFGRTFAKVFESISECYFMLKDYFNALTMWKRAIDVRMSSLN